MTGIQSFIRAFIASSLTAIATAGCVHDVSYHSAKEYRYNVIPAFTPAKITRESWVDPDDHSRAIYTSSNLTAREKYHSSQLGTLHIRHSNDPNDDSIPIVIRKETRAYTAETPILEPLKAGKRQITPNLAVSRHRDHDFVAGLIFRMAF